MIDKLYFGDNCEILGKYYPNNYFDLIYLDSSINSKRNYNITILNMKLKNKLLKILGNMIYHQNIIILN